MAGDRKRKTHQRLADRALIAKLRLQGKTVDEIAAMLGVTSRTIQRDLAAIHEEWKTQTLTDTTDLKAREAARLDMLEAEAYAAWERSKQDWQKKTVEDRPGAGSKTAGRHAKIETGSSPGDPRFLSTLLQIQARRATLLGLDAPQKTALTDPTGEEDRTPMVFPVPPELSLEQWQAACQAALKPKH